MNLMILDPTNEAVPVERHISERPKTLTGKVAFLDISKPRKIPGHRMVDISKVRKSSRRRLLGKIFDKLRIRGRMQILKKNTRRL